MFIHKDKRILPYKVEDVYNLVADVENYPNFIPWVSEARVINQISENKVEYELSVDFKVFKEKITTIDTFYKNEKIDIVSNTGPFKFLTTQWIFKSLNNQNTEVSIEVSFEFRSKIIEAVFSKVFIVAQQKILDAFNKRADAILTKNRG